MMNVYLCSNLTKTYLEGTVISFVTTVTFLVTLLCHNSVWQDHWDINDVTYSVLRTYCMSVNQRERSCTCVRKHISMKMRAFARVYVREHART